MPVFWLGLMGLLLFYGKLGWVGGPGRLDIAYEYIVDRRDRLVLIDTLIAGRLGRLPQRASRHIDPAGGVLGYFSLAYISRMTRCFMLDAARAGIHHHRAGQGPAGVARRSGATRSRNVAVPLITVIALSYAALLEGSVLTETVFAWPGLGLYITNSLFNADMNAVLGGTLVVGAVFIGAQPRLRPPLPPARSEARR